MLQAKALLTEKSGDELDDNDKRDTENEQERRPVPTIADGDGLTVFL